ncbi:MAG: S1 RNA-binding domain-containing protein [Planctomycetota bacterium]|nr:S1 RNA-binding domain-containing protein [Planctomycetota bacterium]
MADESNTVSDESKPGANSATPTAAAAATESPPAEPSPVEPGTESDAVVTAASAANETGPAPDGSSNQTSYVSRQGIQIGSRRDKDTAPATSQPQRTGTDKPTKLAKPGRTASPKGNKPPSAPEIKPPESVPKPSVRDPLSADLEQELESALGDVELGDLMESQSISGASAVLEADSRRRATVVKIHGDHVFFSLGGPNEGVASVRQFKKPPEPGTPMEVIVTGYNVEDGLYELRIPGASIDVADWASIDEGMVVETMVTGSNTGGLECMVNTIRGFIPASQISTVRVENFSEYIGQKLTCVVNESNPGRKKLVLSHRAILEREREAAREQLLTELEVGQEREGIVRSLREFGAFVDLGGIDGLVHISQLSWDRVNHPSDVLAEGQKIQVRINKIDPQSGKIGLAYRELLQNPWDEVDQHVVVNSVVTGTVSRVAAFGAFVRLAPGIEGLIHISELAHQRVANVNSVVQDGQQVEVKVLSVDRDSQRIGLSLKGALPEPEEPESTAEESVDRDPLRDSVVPKHDGPLKGGTNRPAGGEQFGLKW